MDAASYEFDLGGVFLDILQRANAFVPSEAGSIVLEQEDPPVTAVKQARTIRVGRIGCGMRMEWTSR